MSKKKKNLRKNISHSIRNGTTIITRDEFFSDNNNYRKEKYTNKPNTYYREAVVVDSNRNNELALIKFQSSGRFKVKNKQGQVEKYNTYIKTLDDNNKPIRLGEKFKRTNPNYYISPNNANRMKKRSLKSPLKELSNENRNALRQLKGRKK